MAHFGLTLPREWCPHTVDTFNGLIHKYIIPVLEDDTLAEAHGYMKSEVRGFIQQHSRSSYISSHEMEKWIVRVFDRFNDSWFCVASDQRFQTCLKWITPYLDIHDIARLSLVFSRSVQAGLATHRNGLSASLSQALRAKFDRAEMPPCVGIYWSLAYRVVLSGGLLVRASQHLAEEPTSASAMDDQCESNDTASVHVSCGGSDQIIKRGTSCGVASTAGGNSCGASQHPNPCHGSPFADNQADDDAGPARGGAAAAAAAAMASDSTLDSGTNVSESLRRNMLRSPVAVIGRLRDGVRMHRVGQVGMLQALRRDKEVGGMVRALVEWNAAGQWLLDHPSQQHPLHPLKSGISCSSSAVSHIRAGRGQMQDAIATSLLLLAVAASSTDLPGRLLVLREVFIGAHAGRRTRWLTQREPLSGQQRWEGTDRTQTPQEKLISPNPFSVLSPANSTSQLDLHVDLFRPRSVLLDPDILELDEARGHLDQIASPARMIPRNTHGQMHSTTPEGSLDSLPPKLHGLRDFEPIDSTTRAQALGIDGPVPTLGCVGRLQKRMDETRVEQYEVGREMLRIDAARSMEVPGLIRHAREVDENQYQGYISQCSEVVVERAPAETEILGRHRVVAQTETACTPRIVPVQINGDTYMSVVPVTRDTDPCAPATAPAGPRTQSYRARGRPRQSRATSAAPSPLEAMKWLHTQTSSKDQDLHTGLSYILEAHSQAARQIERLNGYWCYCKNWSCCRIFCSSYPWRICLVSWLDACLVPVPLVMWLALAAMTIGRAFPMACMQATLLHKAGDQEISSISDFQGSINHRYRVLYDSTYNCGAGVELQWNGDYDVQQINDAFIKVAQFRTKDHFLLPLVPVAVMLSGLLYTGVCLAAHQTCGYGGQLVPASMHLMWSTWTFARPDGILNSDSAQSIWTSKRVSCWSVGPPTSESRLDYDRLSEISRDSRGEVISSEAYVGAQASDAAATMMALASVLSLVGWQASLAWDSLLDSGSLLPNSSTDEEWTTADARLSEVVRFHCATAANCIVACMMLLQLLAVYRLQFGSQETPTCCGASESNCIRGLCRAQPIRLAALLIACWLCICAMLLVQRDALDFEAVNRWATGWLIVFVCIVVAWCVSIVMIHDACGYCRRCARNRPQEPETCSDQMNAWLSTPCQDCHDISWPPWVIELCSNQYEVYTILLGTVMVFIPMMMILRRYMREGRSAAHPFLLAFPLMSTLALGTIGSFLILLVCRAKPGSWQLRLYGGISCMPVAYARSNTYAGTLADTFNYVGYEQGTTGRFTDLRWLRLPGLSCEVTQLARAVRRRLKTSRVGSDLDWLGSQYAVPGNHACFSEQWPTGARNLAEHNEYDLQDGAVSCISLIRAIRSCSTTSTYFLRHSVSLAKSQYGNATEAGLALLRTHVRLEALLRAAKQLRKLQQQTPDLDRIRPPGSAIQLDAACGYMQMLYRMNLSDRDCHQIECMSAAAVGAAMLLLGGARSLCRGFLTVQRELNAHPKGEHDGMHAGSDCLSHAGGSQQRGQAAVVGPSRLRKLVQPLRVQQALVAGQRAWVDCVGGLNHMCSTHWVPSGARLVEELVATEVVDGHGGRVQPN